MSGEYKNCEFGKGDSVFLVFGFKKMKMKIKINFILKFLHYLNFEMHNILPFS